MFPPSVSYSRLLALRGDHEFRRGHGRAWYMLLLSPGRPGSWLDLEIGLHIGDPQQLHRDSALPEWYKTALSQTQLFRRLIDRQNTKAVSFLNITNAPVKPWEGRGGLQFIPIFIYQLFIKSMLLKVTDNLVVVVECISHFCLSDLSFLWPGLYYLDNPFYFTEHQWITKHHFLKCWFCLCAVINILTDFGRKIKERIRISLMRSFATKLNFYCWWNSQSLLKSFILLLKSTLFSAALTL